MISKENIKTGVSSYVDSILSGDIVSCEFVRKVVKKHQTELERAGDVDFPFYFDEAAAYKACMFFPMLLRHSIGEWAGQPFQLAAWQQYVIWTLFGWKRQDDTRRFRRAFVSIGRKNGKSTLAAGLAILMACGDKEEGAQVIIAASKRDQATIIHGEAERMLRQSPELMRHAEIFKLNIMFPKQNAYIRPVGSDKAYDGLSPSCVILDELHAFKEYNREFFDTMRTGSGARRQPLEMIVTTAGNEKSFLYNETADYARSVVNGDFIDHNVFGIIFEVDSDDDILEESNWIKANPNLGHSIKLDYLKEQATEARAKPHTASRFTRYHANRSILSSDSLISVKMWDSAIGELSDWSKADGIGFGVDVGGKNDLASLGMCARWQIGDDPDKPIYRYEIKSVNFISTETKRDFSQEPFGTWINDGLLIKSDFVKIDLRDRILDDAKHLQVRHVAYDPWNFDETAETLEQNGLVPIEMRQNMAQYSEVISELQDALIEGRMKPDHNDVILRWAALHMSVKRDVNDRAMPNRRDSKDKIDPIVSCLMAMRAVRHAAPPIQGSLVI